MSEMMSNDDVLIHFRNDAIDGREFDLITLAYGGAKLSPTFYATVPTTGYFQFVRKGSRSFMKFESYNLGPNALIN